MTAYLENHVVIERLIDGSDRIVAVGRTYGTVRSCGRIFRCATDTWEFLDGQAVRLEIVIDVPRYAGGARAIVCFSGTHRGMRKSALGKAQHRALRGARCNVQNR